MLECREWCDHEIAHYGRDAIQIPRRLLEMLKDLRDCGQPRYAAMIDAAAQRVRDVTNPRPTPAKARGSQFVST